MRSKAVISILGVLMTASISGIILWLLMDSNGLGHLGLAGVFLVSMFSHLTVVARDMFVPLYLTQTPIYNPLVLGATAGIGAAIGEVTTYLLGRGIAETVNDEENRTASRLSDWIRRYGLWAVLLVAMTPLPDTPIVLIAGSNRLPFGKLFIAECVGKTTLYSLGAVIGGFVFTGLTNIFGSLTASIITVIASLLFCIFVTSKKSRRAIFGWLGSLLL